MRVRPRHYWRKTLRSEVLRRMAAAVCRPEATLSMLAISPRPALSWLDRWIAFLTTPFKRLGIAGWTETGCAAQGAGSPVRDAQHSTDGFWTIDVELAACSIGSHEARLTSPRYLRLEVEPETTAHEICSSRPVREGMPLSFGGAVVIDEDAGFLEVHPDENFRLGV